MQSKLHERMNKKQFEVFVTSHSCNKDLGEEITNKRRKNCSRTTSGALIFSPAGGGGGVNSISGLKMSSEVIFTTITANNTPISALFNYTLSSDLPPVDLTVANEGNVDHATRKSQRRKSYSKKQNVQAK